MKKHSLTLVSLILLAAVLFSFAGCQKKADANVYGVIKDNKFGGFYADISIEDFCADGFEFGDSVNITLDNGKELNDIPFYNGYYTRRGEALICGYPGYEHVKIGRNNGNDLWEELGVTEDTKVTVTLNEKGKYKVIQDTMNTVYQNDRDKFESDIVFANYRAIEGGDLAEGVAFRGVSPADNQYNRASYADELIEDDGIGFILDLADSEEDIQAYIENETYDFENSCFYDLYQADKVALLDMPSNYAGDEFKTKLGQGIKEMIESDGPYYIHCTEGKDRTGFVCLLFEALCGAEYDELLDDYMITYYNYYGLDEEENPEQYDAIVEIKFIDMVAYLTGENSLKVLENTDYTEYAADYLEECGLTEEEIISLMEILIKK